MSEAIAPPKSIYDTLEEVFEAKIIALLEEHQTQLADHPLSESEKSSLIQQYRQIFRDNLDKVFPIVFKPDGQPAINTTVTEDDLVQLDEALQIATDKRAKLPAQAVQYTQKIVSHTAQATRLIKTQLSHSDEDEKDLLKAHEMSRQDLMRCDVKSELGVDEKFVLVQARNLEDKIDKVSEAAQSLLEAFQ